MSKPRHMWAIVDSNTGQVVWTKSKHKAVFKSRQDARDTKKAKVSDRPSKIVKYDQFV